MVWSAQKCRITLAAATVSVACLVPAGTASAQTTILPTTILPTTSLPTTSLPTTATVTTAPATTTPATTATTSIPPVQIPNPVTPADVSPPVAALAKKLAATVKGGGFSFSFQGSEAGTWKALLYVVQGGAKASAKKSVLIGSGKVTTAAAGKAAMKVKLNKKGKALFRRKRNTNAVLKLKGADKAGNASSALTRKVALKRR